MKPNLAEYLACPHDGSDLKLSSLRFEDGEVQAGEIACPTCRRTWPIRDGIPRFVDSFSSEAAVSSGIAFAREWTDFSKIEPHHQEQFEGWIAPFQPSQFHNRIVLEGGCGKGRHSATVHDYGAAAIVAVDIGESIDVAYRNNRERHRCHFIQADLLRLPVKPVFDIVFSVGVLHHLEEPLEGARELAGVLKPGGLSVFWVYGRENNGWIVRAIDPLRRRLTSRLPHRALKALSAVFTLPLWGALKTIYRFRSSKGLPYGHYFHSIARFPFREVHSIVYDHLVAPTAHYLTESEAAALVTSSGLWLRHRRHHNRQSWSVIGEKPLCGDPATQRENANPGGERSN